MSNRVAVSVIALLLTAGVHPCQAQSHGIGGRIGPTFTTFAGDFSAKSKTGFILSGFFTYSFGERLSVSAELSYVRKGASPYTGLGMFFDPVTGVVVEETYELTTNLNYGQLQVPIALMVPVRRLGFRFYAGPAIALELSCTGELRIETEEFAPSGDRISTRSSTESGACGDESSLGWPLGTATKSLDLGLIFGAGIDVHIGRGAIIGDLRYDLGLKDIHDGTPGSIKNRALQIMVGYAYYFSR